MKIERSAKRFIPIVITLETHEEARTILSALIIGNCHMPRNGFSSDECIPSKVLIAGLQGEGIREL